MELAKCSPPPLPALFIPGTLCDDRLFEPIARRLGLVPLFASYGRSASVEEAARTILEDAPHRFLVLGFSLGGFIALEMLRRAPDRLLGAVLIASNAHPVSPGTAADLQRQAAIFREDGPEALIASLWSRYVSPRSIHREDIRTTLTEMAASFSIADFERQARISVTRPDSRPNAGDGVVPVFVLCGGDDLTCTPDRCEAAATATGAEVRTLPGVGHFLPLEAPEEVAAAIGEWLASFGPAIERRASGATTCC